MDIIKELKQFHNDSYDNLARELAEKSENLRKKSYIFTILNMARELQIAVDNNHFSHLVSVSLKQEYDYDLGDVFDDATFISEDNNIIKGTSYDNKAAQIIDDMFGRYYFTLEEQLYPVELNKATITIYFNDPIEPQFIEIFLNEELKTILNYSQLSIDAVDNNSHKIKNKV